MARNEKMKKKQHIVVDASVVTRWYVDEEWSDMALKLRDDYHREKLILIAPFLILYEVGNALRYCKELNKEDVINALKNLFKLQIRLVYLDDQFIEKMTEIAFLNNITAYDSSYCAISEIMDCIFISGDEKLTVKMNKPNIISLRDYENLKI